MSYFIVLAPSYWSNSLRPLGSCLRFAIPVRQVSARLTPKAGALIRRGPSAPLTHSRGTPSRAAATRSRRSSSRRPARSRAPTLPAAGRRTRSARATKVKAATMTPSRPERAGPGCARAAPFEVAVREAQQRRQHGRPRQRELGIRGHEPPENHEGQPPSMTGLTPPWPARPRTPPERATRPGARRALGAHEPAPRRPASRAKPSTGSEVFRREREVRRARRKAAPAPCSRGGPPPPTATEASPMLPRNPGRSGPAHPQQSPACSHDGPPHEDRSGQRDAAARRPEQHLPPRPAVDETRRRCRPRAGNPVATTKPML